MGLSIEVTIDELALTGFDRVNRDQVAAAFRRELGRLLADSPVDGPIAASSDSSYDLINGPSMPATLTSRRLGTELARAVHTGLTRQGEEPP